MATDEAAMVQAIQHANSLRTGVMVKNIEGNVFTIKRIFKRATGSPTGNFLAYVELSKIVYQSGPTLRQLKNLEVDMVFKHPTHHSGLYDFVRSGKYRVVGYDPKADFDLQNGWRDEFKVGVYQHYRNGQFYRVVGLGMDTSNSDTEDKVTVLYSPLYPAQVEVAFFHRPGVEFFGYSWFGGELVRRFEYCGTMPPNPEIAPLD